MRIVAALCYKRFEFICTLSNQLLIAENNNLCVKGVNFSDMLSAPPRL